MEIYGWKLERINKERILRLWTLVIYEKGRSQYRRDLPDLVISGGENGLSIGEYVPNTIRIWVGPHLNFKEIASTLLHEYEHYLQFWPWYTRYMKMYGYKKNPYEAKAIEAELLAPLLIQETTDDSWKALCRKNKEIKRLHLKYSKSVRFNV